MANFDVNDAKFTTEINKLEITTPAHADVFNDIFEALLNNDVFVKKMAEHQIQVMQMHLSNEDSPHQNVFDEFYKQLTSYTDNKVGVLNNGLIDKIYPVGSIYMSANNVSPASFIGGTWEQIQNRFLLAAGSSYAAGATGGEAAHVLSAAEMPSHSHGFSATSAYASNDHTHGFAATTGTVSADHAHSGFTSADGMHTHNMRIRRDNSASGGVDRIGNANAYAEVQTSNMESAGYHSHSVQTYGFSANHVHAVSGTTGGINASHTHGVSGNTAAVGGGAAHNNMPPYLAVYMWKRTA